MDFSALLDRLPEAGAILSKVYSFLRKKIGERKAKKELSLIFQECLKINPNMRFIKRTLAQYEGKTHLKADVDEIKGMAKKTVAIATTQERAGVKIAKPDMLSSRGGVKSTSKKRSKTHPPQKGTKKSH
jgi:hypothetical protein